MKDLIAKLEAAPEAQQELVFLEVLELARNRNWINDDTHERARQWVINGAYLSAAEVLVPEKYAWRLQEVVGSGMAIVAPEGKKWNFPKIHAATPALAITIAAMKAHDSQRTDTVDEVNQFG